MKKVFALFLTLFAFSSTALAFNHPTGFNGIKWGDTPGMHSNKLSLVSTKTKEDLRIIATYADKTPRWGNIKAKLIFYYFDSTGFYSALVLLDIDKKPDLYKKALNLWGAPHKKTGEKYMLAPDCEWKNQHVRIVLREDFDTDVILGVYHYSP